MGSSFFKLKKADDVNWYRFSSEDIRRLMLFESDREHHVQQKGMLLVMDSAPDDGMQPALNFLQKILAKQIPDGFELKPVLDQDASLSAQVIKRSGTSTAMVTIESECLFGREGSGHVVSAGSVKMDFRRIEGTRQYVLDGIRTDSALVVASFRSDTNQMRDALRDIESSLDHREMSAGSKGLHY